MRGRKTRVVAICALIGVVVLAAPVGLRAWHLLRYARQKEVGVKMIQSLRERRPAAVPSQTWDTATGWAITAFHNVCFSERCVTYEELVRFTDDASLRLAGEVSLESVDWVWARLGKTGPLGREYVAKWEPIYRDNVYGASTNDAPQ